MSTRRIAAALLIAGLAACGSERKTEATDPRRVASAAARTKAPEVAIEIGGEVLPDPVDGLLASGPLLYTVQLTPVADTNTDWNPVNSIELFSDLGLTTKLTGGVCGIPDTEGDVTIVNYLPEGLVNLQLEFNPIAPTGHKICTPLPANRDPSLVTTFGIIDYSTGGDVGSYTANQASSVIAGKSVVGPNGSMTKKWAFARPDAQSFTWRARIYANLRPYASKIETPYVDAATVWSNGGEPQPKLWVISDDSVGAPFSFPPIVTAVHMSTYLDPAATQPAGDTDSTFIMSTTDANDPNWGTGVGTSLAATSANIGRTIYARMQNEWVNGSSVTKLGQQVTPGSNPDRTFLITQPASVPALGVVPTGGPVTYTVAPQATGAEIEIYNRGAGRNPTCTNVAVGTKVYPANASDPPVAIGTSGTFSVTGLGLTPGSPYCYHVRNTFTTRILGATYPGSWSNYSSFTR